MEVSRIVSHFILFILLTWKIGCFLYYHETVAKLMFANLIHFNWPSLLSHCWYKDFSVHSVHISTGHFTFCFFMSSLHIIATGFCLYICSKYFLDKHSLYLLSPSEHSLSRVKTVLFLASIFSPDYCANPWQKNQAFASLFPSLLTLVSPYLRICNT